MRKCAAPQVGSGVIQARHRAEIVHGGQIGSFNTVAEPAGACQVCHYCRAAVLAADDVVDFMRQRGVSLVDQAVLAATLGTLKNLDTEFQADFHALPARIRRARALAMRRMCSSSTK